MTRVGFTGTPGRPTALFARVPAASAAKLERASTALGRPKQELIAALLDRYLDALGDEWAVGHAEVRAPAAPEVLTLQQLAELLQLSPELVREHAARGQLPGRKLGREWRFSRVAVLDWLRG